MDKIVTLSDRGYFGKLYEYQSNRKSGQRSLSVVYNRAIQDHIIGTVNLLIGDAKC